MIDVAITGAILSVRATSWLTPVWLLGVGSLVGLLLVAILWGLALALSRVPGLTGLRRPAIEFVETITEGPLLWAVVVFALLSVWGVAGTFMLRSPAGSLDIIGSLGRKPFVGTTEYSHTIPRPPVAMTEDLAADPPENEIAISFVGNELREIVIETSENVSIAREPGIGVDSTDSIRLRAGEDFRWRRREATTNPFAPGNPFADLTVEHLYVRNMGGADAELRFTVTTDLVHPQVAIVPMTAIAVVLISLLYFLQRTFAPRMSAIALATFKSEVAQPMFPLVLIVGLFLLALFYLMPYNTFGEDIKVYKETCLTMLKILCIFLAVWGASTTINEEIEGRTALTVLSKPIRRRSFVLGKFSGIAWTVGLMFLILGVAFLAATAWKTIYDAREASKEVPTWQLCHLEMASAMPGLALAFMETIVLAAFSVAISTRLPLLANFVICFAVYVLGHLTPLLVQVSDDRLEFVKFIGQLIATVVPNLEVFDTQAAIAAGFTVPAQYVGWALLYCLLFSSISMLLALVLFEDRDLA